MSWKDKCAAALGEMRLYENSGHKTRFMELMECYSGYPFFTKGLCKCMYLSAWDEEHFAVMLEMLTSMALGEEHDTEDMKFQGDVIADEKIDEHAYGEAYVFKLSGMFLEGDPGVPEGREKLSAEYEYIVSRALEASWVIDHLTDR